MLFCILIPIIIGVGFGVYYSIARTIPSLAELKQSPESQGARIYADDDTQIGEIKTSQGVFVKLKDISPHMINAVIAVEDASFWRHGGIDYLAIMRAVAVDIVKGHLKEGGSTITQQLAKNTLLTPEKTFKRKIKELILARRIEHSMSKEEILETYLNKVYLGSGAYGVQMAAHAYFGKDAKYLTLPEAALIAGLLKAPSSFSPFNDLERARARQQTVLLRMEEEGLISRRQRTEAEQYPVSLSSKIAEGNEYAYFVDYVKTILVREYGEEAVMRGGMKVYTTMDRHMQRAAQAAIRNGLRSFDKRRGWRGALGHKDLAAPERKGDAVKPSIVFKNPLPGDILRGTVMRVDEGVATVHTEPVTGKLYEKDAQWAQAVLDPQKQRTVQRGKVKLRDLLKPGDIIEVAVRVNDGARVEFSLEQPPDVQSALVAMEPDTGYVRALVGGSDYSKSQFNRAINASRQVGSAFKPIIYSSAMESGSFTPASIIVDEELKYNNPDGSVWSPKNFDGKYHGPTRLREALTHSRNVVTVKLVEAVGIGRVLDTAARMGVRTAMPRDLTIALGSLSLTPLELATVYDVLANGGMKVEPTAIKFVRDRSDNMMPLPKPEPAEALDPQSAYLVGSMMRDVVQFGTGGAAKALGRPVAGKTGTTNDFKDAWFVGFTTEMLATVWVGFDELKPLGSAETGATGGGAAAPIWVEFMKNVPSRGKSPEFDVPEGIVTRLIDPETGKLATKWTEGAYTDYFKEGTEPKESAKTPWNTHERENIVTPSSSSKQQQVSAIANAASSKQGGPPTPPAPPAPKAPPAPPTPPRR